MRKRKLFLFIVLFLAVLTGFRLLWLLLTPHPVQPQLMNGVLDLRKDTLNKDKLLTLNGQWEFYPGTLLPSFNNKSLTNATISKKYIQVPGNWNNQFSDGDKPAYGYGSYRLRVLLDTDDKRSYSIFIPVVATSSKVYIDGELQGSSGSPAEDKEHYTARILSYSGSFISDNGEIEIVIQAANYIFAQTGGITKPILFGSEKAITQQRLISMGLQLLLCVVLILHAIYAALLYIIGLRQKMLFYFFLLVISAITSVIIDDDKLLLYLLPLDYQWSFKLLFISNIFTFIFILQTIKHLLMEDIKIKSANILISLSVAHILFIIVGPVVQYNQFYTLMFGINLFALAFVVVIIILKSILRNLDGSFFLLLAIIAIMNSTLWGFLKNLDLVVTIYYPFDLIIAFLSFATFAFKRYLWSSKQTENLAESLQRIVTQKDAFLANTSHELRNPLHSIINIAETVLDSERESLMQQNTENLELLITVGRRMSLLINDLLDQSQLRESNIQLQLSNIQIQSVAVGVLDMLKFLTEGKPIQLISEIPDSFPSIVADEKRLIQILFNLLQNAVKNTSVGSVRIHADIHKGSARIHITDTGTGMSEDTMRRAFQPYEQGDSSMTSIIGGIGLGLSICKQLVELHGGEISAVSTLGKGTTFTFSMVLSEIAQGEFAPELSSLSEFSDTLTMMPQSEIVTISNSSTDGRKPKILVVDDDPVNLKILTGVLSFKDYEMVTVTSGVDALMKLDTDQWDLVITDVMMPHMSGYELTQKIRERFTIAELPILLLTARSQPEDIYTGFMTGANDYVMKPMNAMELKGRVRSLTDLKQSVNERLRVEAAYLQAQIQPHFLFNTLNSISALASFDTDRMSQLIDAFSSYLRLSFNFLNAEPMIPIERELELVRAYLYIEKERFDDRMTIKWELPENLHFQLPPLTIQPIVENAVRHGILSRSKGGTVAIAIQEYADYIEITITDNGKGMTSEQLQQLLSSQSNATRGIGFLNTHKRLLRVYGKGLQIKSKEGQGTSVTFTINSKK